MLEVAILASPLAAAWFAGLTAMLHPAWLAGLIAIALPFAGRTYLQRRRQIRDLSALARRRNLKFSPVDLIGLHERYYNLELIRQGHNRYAWNVLYGSIDAGLVAIFRYSYDLGFGVNQTSTASWMAVLECPQPLDTWQAIPTGSAEADRATGGLSASASDSGGAAVGPFTVRADHAETLGRLQQSQVQAVLREMPYMCHIEVRGLLIAVAIPYDSDLAVPERLLDCIAALAGHLRNAGM